MKTIHLKYLSSLAMGMLFSNSCILTADPTGKKSSDSTDFDSAHEKEPRHPRRGPRQHHDRKRGHGHPPHHPGHGPHFFEWTETENKLLLEKYEEYNGNWEEMVPLFKSRFAKQLEFHHKRLTENATDFDSAHEKESRHPRHGQGQHHDRKRGHDHPPHQSRARPSFL